MSSSANEALSTVKCMKMLGNSTRGLLPHQKSLLYRSCVLLLVLYRFLLWFFNKAPLSYPLKKLRKMQQRSAIWIMGFCTSPTLGVEAITGLIPIHLHLQKLSGRYQIRTTNLSSNHAISSALLKNRHSKNTSLHFLSLENMTFKQ